MFTLAPRWEDSKEYIWHCFSIFWWAEYLSWWMLACLSACPLFDFFSSLLQFLTIGLVSWDHCLKPIWESSTFLQMLFTICFWGCSDTDNNLQNVRSGLRLSNFFMFSNSVGILFKCKWYSLRDISHMVWSYNPRFYLLNSNKDLVMLVQWSCGLMSIISLGESNNSRLVMVTMFWECSTKETRSLKWGSDLWGILAVSQVGWQNFSRGREVGAFWAWSHSEYRILGGLLTWSWWVLTGFKGLEILKNISVRKVLHSANILPSQPRVGGKFRFPSQSLLFTYLIW